jgi:long-chain acyl-CoA synthetase
MSDASYAARPWERQWTVLPDPAAGRRATVPEAWSSELPSRAERPWLQFFETTLTFADGEREVAALAAGLRALGVGRGDRVALYLQNVPQYPIALLAIWRLGATAVACSPMLRAKELKLHLGDSGAVAIISLEALHAATVEGVLQELDGLVAVTTSEWEYGGPDGRRAGRAPQGAHDFGALIARHHDDDPTGVEVTPEEVAVLTYTSGTTGPPKGAMNTHGNIVHSSEVLRRWASLDADDAILGIAPLFHATGLVAHATVSMWAGTPLVLASRFDAAETCRLVERHRCTFTVAAITAFIALLESPAADHHDLSSLRKAYSGGAAVPLAVAAAWEAKTGGIIHNIYGMTETTSPSHMVPLGVRAPVDPGSGAMSVGVPVYGTDVRIVDADGVSVPVGGIGEIATRGPQVVPGYWNRPDETVHAMDGGEMRTGDVGLMDEHGWFYVIDRLKDMINASGYKVWPREVEEVLFTHPSVNEAAVVGVPDAYRGESVKAFVTVAAGADPVTAEEIIAFARERLAAYKYPRVVEILDELPKTASGKVLRRALRRAGP